MRIYHFIEARKWVMALKLIGIIIFNILLLGGAIIYYSAIFLYVLIIQLIIDALFVWGFLSTRKTLCITEDSLVIFYLYRKEIYLFSNMETIRFFYSLEKSRDSGEVTERVNTCEIKLRNSRIYLEITEKEISDFNDFKFHLLAITGNEIA